MLDALRALGIACARPAATSGYAMRRRGRRVSGQAGRLFLGTAGLSMRTLVAALAFCGGHYRADGVPRMRERPIGDLVDALRALGADIAL